jgi:hypothetical protein
MSDEWYTPAWIFDAISGAHVPCRASIGAGSLEKTWDGFVWMNPPFGGRNGLVPWLDKFFDHGNGIALTPDRTSTDWWQDAARRADAILFVRGKIKFERPDGTVGKQPGNGTTLFASGPRAVTALRRSGLGFTA